MLLPPPLHRLLSGLGRGWLCRHLGKHPGKGAHGHCVQGVGGFQRRPFPSTVLPGHPVSWRHQVMAVSLLLLQVSEGCGGTALRAPAF